MHVHQSGRQTSVDPSQQMRGYHQQQQQMMPPPQAQMPPPMQHMQQQQQMMQQMPPSMDSNEQRFYQHTHKLVPSVKAENPHMKQQVGNAIFDFVQLVKGRDLAPKITGMLIDLNLDEIQAYLTNYREFLKKVNEAANLLTEMSKAQQQTPGAPQMAMPQPGAPMQTPMPGMPQPGVQFPPQQPPK